MPQTDPNMERKAVDLIDRVSVSSGWARWVVLPCNTVACNTFGYDARNMVKTGKPRKSVSFEDERKLEEHLNT